ncbi:DNA (cytosine-5)-methyltransferase 1 [Lachnotalea glycerini]|uniref:DNA (cytosine-5-)-methyltransferase n=1 Tax=Lachnotalea glycerini TaxID=1763509 RepID=A0A318EQP9_9FIRM|nr:DNA cytosine methyltransferase [Lachnotalea glycerini]PXV88420.1 DNA (cytosine-5)-methyltransferase 1 [Lachnotalea glycerini]
MINGELIVDNFAGGGEASTGIELATGRSVDIAINHDPEAIKMHKANHPSTKHYCESVWDVNPVEACKGRPVALAWFSPDCKHFSKAKGGTPVKKEIRGLAWVAIRWAAAVRPRVIMLENVEEFKTWGPLRPQRDKETGRCIVYDFSDRKNKNEQKRKPKFRVAQPGEVVPLNLQVMEPDPKRKGRTFRKFVKALEALGYEVEFKELVAADFGTPTKRKRFFMIARCDGHPIVWPEPTHAPVDSEKVKADICKPYVGAYTQIDFNRPCPSIFDTAEEIKEKYKIRAVRPLAPKTMQRIARGLQKFVIDNEEPFIVQVNHSGSDWSYTHSMNEPLATVDGSNRYGLVTSFLHKYYDGNYKGAGSSLSEPLHTVTAVDHNSIVTTNLIQMNNNCDGRDIRQPIPTITAGDGHFGEVRAFLIKYYGQGTGQEIKEPLDTVTSNDRFGLVTIHGVDYQIVDIGLRMLEPKELYGCQGFPDDYIIDKDFEGKTYSRTEQVKRCGNAVPPPFANVLVRANLPEICIFERVPNMSIEVENKGQLRFA